MHKLAIPTSPTCVYQFLLAQVLSSITLVFDYKSEFTLRCMLKLATPTCGLSGAFVRELVYRLKMRVYPTLHT